VSRAGTSGTVAETCTDLVRLPRSDPPAHYRSPLRHHHRVPSAHRQVKVNPSEYLGPLRSSNLSQETLNARSEYSNSEDDGVAQHRINQYLIKQEIGRGSFGAVHHAVDQYGTEYVSLQIRPIRRFQLDKLSMATTLLEKLAIAYGHRS
jgi:calcium/calmodulin-dependent protein kinase kinase 2